MAPLSFCVQSSRRRRDVNSPTRRRLVIETLEDRCLLASAPLKYDARQPSSAIQVDGKLDEAAWRTAIGFTDFYVLNSGGTAAPPTTTARLLWDQNFLYVGFEVIDQHINSAGLGHDGDLFNGDNVEVF